MISIIVLTYNRAKLLSASLRSILGQTYRDTEVIVVDDGSTDDTKEVVNSFSDERIIYVNDGKIRNISKLRNKGVNMARGDLIAFCDDDDLWMENKLEVQMKYLDQDVIVCTDGSVIDCDYNVIHKKGTPFNSDCFIDLKVLLHGNCILTSSLIVYKYILEEVGLFDENIINRSEDYDLWLRLAGKNRIKFINQDLISYRVHGSNLSIKSYTDRIELAERNVEILSRYLNSDDKSLIEAALNGTIANYAKLALYYYRDKQISNSYIYSRKLVAEYKSKISFRYVKYILFYFFILTKKLLRL